MDVVTVGAAAPVTRAPSRVATTIVLVVVGVVGFVLRILPLWAPAGGTDSDEAVVGLMAKHVFDGRLPVFYWGQSYGGTPEVAVAALFRELFGSSIVVLRLPDLLYGILAALLLWKVASALLPRRQAIVATAAFWLSPMLLIDYASREMLFYAPTLVVGLGMLLLAVRFVEHPEALWRPALFWFLGGLGFWMGANIAYFALPALIYVAWSVRRVPWAAVARFPLFFLGSAPWWIWNASHGWGSIEYARAASGPGALDNLAQYGHDGLRVVFGLYYVYETASRRSVTTVLLVVLLVPLTIVAVGAVRRAAAGRAPVPLDVIGFVAAPFIYAVLPYRLPIVVVRFFLFAWPFASLLIGRLAVARWATALVGAGLALSLFVNVRFYLDAPGRVPDLTAARQALEAAGRTTFFGDYWSAYQLTYESDERVVGSPFYTARWPAYDAAARASPASAYVFLSGADDLDLVLAAAQARGLQAQVVPAGAYVVVLLNGQLPPEAVANRALSGI